MPSPSSKRATKRSRSSITEPSFHGINTPGQRAENDTHVSGTLRSMVEAAQHVFCLCDKALHDLGRRQ